MNKELKIYYSIRVVLAENEEQAIEKVEDNAFDETNELCDKVLLGSTLMESLPEFEQYRKESIKWGIADFMGVHNSSGLFENITKEQAQSALEEMIKNHDAEYGICHETVRHYYYEYATRKTIAQYWVLTSREGTKVFPFTTNRDAYNKVREMEKQEKLQKDEIILLTWDANDMNLHCAKYNLNPEDFKYMPSTIQPQTP